MERMVEKMMRLGKFCLVLSLLAFAAAPGSATELTFQADGVGVDDLMPQNYGDNVSGSPDGNGHQYAIGNGWTPNIQVDYAAAPQTSGGLVPSLDYFPDWDGEPDVLYLRDGDDGNDPLGNYWITFTPDADIGVQINSFDLDDWGETSHEIDWTIYQDEVGGTVLDSGSTGSFSGDMTVTTSGLSYTGTLVLELTHTGTRTYLAVDNLNFDQVSLKGVVIEESDGSTVVSEDGVSDTLAISLEFEPPETVYVDICERWRDPNNDLLVDSTVTEDPNNFVRLTFTTGDWSDPQIVDLSAVDDEFVEGIELAQLVVKTASSDPNIGGTGIVLVTVIDNDLGEIYFTESDGSTEISEVGPSSDTYEIAVSTMPDKDVIVDISDAGGQVQIQPSAQIVFTDSDWGAKTITVTAVDDGDWEGDPHTATITHQASTAGSLYADANNLPDVVVTIQDNDCDPAKTFLAADLNQDCSVDILDLAELAVSWLMCTNINVPGCVDPERYISVITNGSFEDGGYSAENIPGWKGTYDVPPPEGAGWYNIYHIADEGAYQQPTPAGSNWALINWDVQYRDNNEPNTVPPGLDPSRTDVTTGIWTDLGTVVDDADWTIGFLVATTANPAWMGDYHFTQFNVSLWAGDANGPVTELSRVTYDGPANGAVDSHEAPLTTSTGHAGETLWLMFDIHNVPGTYGYGFTQIMIDDVHELPGQMYVYP